ncbi:MAG: hypothetical protein FWD33_01825 [Alphaproteobacteria bacterium]|nr:hypothetical protein [Alphaproteobacteria bacterium]
MLTNIADGGRLTTGEALRNYSRALSFRIVEIEKKIKDLRNGGNVDIPVEFGIQDRGAFIKILEEKMDSDAAIFLHVRGMMKEKGLK